MFSYLRRRKGHFYLRLRVPSDLQGLSSSPEILKSLRTTDLKLARLSASSLLPEILKVFTLLRGGYISEDQAKGKLSDVLRRTPKLTSSKPSAANLPPASPTLQKVIEQYTKDHETAWTAKTRLEYESYYRLLLDVVGDRMVNQIDRDAVRNLRDTLIKLPPHIYKKHTGMTIQQVLAIPDLTPMSISTVNKLLTLLGSIMRHSVKEGHVSINPVEGLKIKGNRRAEDERKAYTKVDLKKIFLSLPSLQHPTWASSTVLT